MSKVKMKFRTTFKKRTYCTITVNMNDGERQSKGIHDDIIEVLRRYYTNVEKLEEKHN